LKLSTVASPSCLRSLPLIVTLPQDGSEGTTSIDFLRFSLPGAVE
jgi:hypothetical protein